jgi:hypothetical protein
MCRRIVCYTLNENSNKIIDFISIWFFVLVGHFGMEQKLSRNLCLQLCLMHRIISLAATNKCTYQTHIVKHRVSEWSELFSPNSFSLTKIIICQVDIVARFCERNEIKILKLKSHVERSLNPPMIINHLPKIDFVSFFFLIHKYTNIRILSQHENQPLFMIHHRLGRKNKELFFAH